MGRRTPTSKIHSPTAGGFPQIDALFYKCLVWAFAAAASASEWFSIAAYQSRPVRRGLSIQPPAGEKDLLRVLRVSAVKLGFSLDFFVEIVICISMDGGSYRGNTAGSGPVNRGSNPRPPAKINPFSGEKAKPGPLDLAFFVMGAAWRDNFIIYPHLV